MEDALAVRLGEELRNRRRAAGLTQSGLAGRIPHYDAESTRTIISKCERGRIVPSETMLKAFDRELAAGGALVALVRAARSPSPRGQVAAFTGSGPAGDDAEEVATDRRQFAALSALAIDTVRRMDTLGASVTLGELKDDVADLALHYDTTPHPQLLASASRAWRQVETMLDRRLTVTDNLRTTRLGGQLTYYLGRLAFAAGQYRDARRFCDLADRYASQVADDILVGSLAGLRSSIAYYTHRWDEAAQVAARARPGAAPYLAARLAAYEARGLARLGRSQATVDVLADMRAAAGTSVAPRPGSSPFSPGSAAMFGAVCAIELGDGAAAERHARDALALVDPANHEEQAHAHLCLALAYLLQAQPDPGRAVAATRAAVDVPAGHLTSTIMSGARRVWRDLRPWTSDPDVQALGALVTPALALPGSGA
ncbi:helix-turn-helix domain-containing protein [Frankia sp. CNm7]|uniref:Helix-turn-helix domain-containing protein n=1 Tax=Frankia nepalensis TaxID=1836974 RepID=A0A937RE15_9ACTN|nr:helix-turn-helix transcriptional regulator [Frankia nepalensis]MBL7496139.1 helix-turn-helix domain-containing protein [Frankia nepalensis]MBL7508922.1 helix-turn-helix domain-containing protein [Frankia nepalensis]MBL7516762.1 helix-turn-helix domain-containing protein [Frankia nepalensis]MBL7628700.1 helix-turn-helix domain-containing protein [Frankia nepalensis]